jgi:hypothetical protein
MATSSDNDKNVNDDDNLVCKQSELIYTKIL